MNTPVKSVTRRTLFVSDLHLTPDQPALSTAWRALLQREIATPSDLYILGDLFDVWLGDDVSLADFSEDVAALRRFVDAGHDVFVMVGNRDFLLGAAFERASGCQLISEPWVIEFAGAPTLLLHGDTLCTADHDYLAFRAQVRDPVWQRQFLAQDAAQRRAIAGQYREASKAHSIHKAVEIMDVTDDAVRDVMMHHHVTYLIHGHTHRPAVHHLTLDGRAAQRIVLGDWRAAAGHANARIVIGDAAGCRQEDFVYRLDH